MVDKKGVNIVQLYLEEWQATMVKEKLHTVCTFIEIEASDVAPGPSSRYMVGKPFDKGAKNMYLTDWQIKELKNELGQTCDFIQLSEKILPSLKYIAPTK